MAHPDTGSTEDIIEKKASSPVATSCLVIACVGLLGAIFFQVWEIADYRSKITIPTVVQKGIGQDMARAAILRLEGRVREILDSSAAGVSGVDAVDSPGLDGAPLDEGGLEPAPLEEPEDDGSGL